VKRKAKEMGKMVGEGIFAFFFLIFQLRASFDGVCLSLLYSFFKKFYKIGGIGLSIEDWCVPSINEAMAGVDSAVETQKKRCLTFFFKVLNFRGRPIFIVITAIVITLYYKLA